MPSVHAPPRTIVVTGGHTGLGLAASRHLLAAAPNLHLVWAVRSPDTARRAAAAALGSDGARVTVLPLDLAALAAVRALAADLGARLDAGALPPLGAVVCNAGIQFAGGGPHRTADGVEQTFGVNYLAHFLLVDLLLPRLAADGRVVVVSSGTHHDAPRLWTSALFGMPAPRYLGAAALARGAVPAGLDSAGAKADQFRYGTSKLCDLLWVYELDRRLRAAGSGVTVTAFDPGLMPGTGLARANKAVGRWAWAHVLPALRLFPGVNSTETSGGDLAWLASDPAAAGVSGQYFERRRAVASSALSRRPELGAELWAASAQLAAEPLVAEPRSTAPRAAEPPAAGRGPRADRASPPAPERQTAMTTAATTPAGSGTEDTTRGAAASGPRRTRRLRGKVALVTSAPRSIGRAIACGGDLSDSAAVAALSAEAPRGCGPTRPAS